MFIFICLIIGLPTAYTITISPNGNNPHEKMDTIIQLETGFQPMMEKPIRTNYEKSRKLNYNISNLSANERNRRLIPYMTFYYTNEQTQTPAGKYENYDKENLLPLQQNNVPLRQTQKDPNVRYKNKPKYNQHELNPIKPGNPIYIDKGFYGDPFIQEQAPRSKKPNLNLFRTDNSDDVQYYITDNASVQKYKLVPYEQTPPIKVPVSVPVLYHTRDNIQKHKPIAVPVTYQPYKNNAIVTPVNYQDLKSSKTTVKLVPFYQHVKENQQQYQKVIPVPVLATPDHIRYAKPNQKPRDQIIYEINHHEARLHKPTIVTESYYDSAPRIQYTPKIETGFHPITPQKQIEYTTEAIRQKSVPTFQTPSTKYVYYHPEDVANNPETKSDDVTPRLIENTTPKYVVLQTDNDKETSLRNLIKKLEDNNRQKVIASENMDDSLKTLLRTLMNYRTKAALKPVLSTPKPFYINTEAGLDRELLDNKVEEKRINYEVAEPISEVDAADFGHNANEVPSQYLDDYHGQTNHGTSQSFPLVTEDGGTPGRPGVDYPTLDTIPETSFDCKTQRYKGFFADPDTRCQVWHYCELNGGQASFLCPNGTVFSQAALTCDWWFNVRCASTTQLYVLNERLYKYILPHQPTFPEDYSGPLVDKYLSLKFKEMEEQFRKNKNKVTVTSEPTENTLESVPQEVEPVPKLPLEEVSSSHEGVIVDHSGSNGAVQRLE